MTPTIIHNTMNNNKLKSIHQFNRPPQSYCASYSSLPESLDDTEEYPCKQLLAAALLQPATCSVSNFTVTTPFKPKAWAYRLAATRYPFPAAAVTLVACLNLGVDLGFQGDRSRIQIGPNLVSSLEHPKAITDNIKAEIANGRRKGPFKSVPLPAFYSNPLGIVFKKGKDKPRVVHHLSWPRTDAKTSVNASILDFEVKLDAFDQALNKVKEIGKGCYMSKIDIEAAYRCIPVQPADWPLLGLEWEGNYYFDIVMQFGITSATAIFEWYSSAAQYIAERSCAIEHMVHYVDDFMLLNARLAPAKFQLERVVQLFDELGIPISLKKLEGPATSMIFLGILFDTASMTIRLDDEKLESMHEELALWTERTSASREELQSIIGILSFAAKVVPTGRTFLRRMIDHLKSLPSSSTNTQQHPLSVAFHRDLNWWRQFLSAWNGISLIPDCDWTPAHVLEIYTDACVDGYGALFGTHWFACKWTSEEEDLAARDKRDSMPFKELYALTRAAATWSSHWRGRKILFHCDCQPIVDAWRKGDSRKPAISQLIRTLLFIAASNDFNMNIMHIAGVDNTCADLLSRGQVQRFKEFRSQHDHLATIPLPLPTQTW